MSDTDFKITWIDRGREPQNQPDPNFTFTSLSVSSSTSATAMLDDCARGASSSGGSSGVVTMV